MNNIDVHAHVTGRSIYVDDIPEQRDTLYAAIFSSPVAHGTIKSLDTSGALATKGVHAVFTARDIPGENQIGGIANDEVLLASHTLSFHGQPVALVVAEGEIAARNALEAIRIEVEEFQPVIHAREAFSKNMLLSPSSTFQHGNVDKAWAQCAHIVQGQSESGAQEHLYIETQGSYAIPQENGNIRIHSSTQGPTHVQKTAARLLALPMHRIEVDVNRLGGGFGGKEDQATAYACMAAMASHLLHKPVKLVLHRMDDMKFTGKRHPYSADFKMGLSADYKILAYEATFYQNGGAATDLSPAILQRSLFHSTNCYAIPNTRVTAHSCKTHLPPNTAFRGFGGPQGMFVMEAAIAKAATIIGVPALKIQKKNFLKEGDAFQYGQIARNVRIGACHKLAEKTHKLKELQQEVGAFNRENDWQKKGLAVMPICFGISFTNKSMNQARALVHIYQDGSVGVSTGAIEMGQGVNTKILQVAATTLGISPHRIKLETTNTTRVSNTSPTAASSGADLNGKATQLACQKLKQRLSKTAAAMLKQPHALIALKNDRILVGGEPSATSWEDLVAEAHTQRVCLSEQGHYTTPRIHFDNSKGKGHPFAYHVYGISIWVARLDCIRGTHAFEKALIVHDFGQSMNPQVDLGQVEGAVVQGMGWMTMEEVKFSEQGVLLANSLSTYKVPDVFTVPHQLQCIALDAKGPHSAILRSKAVGEPPLMYGIGAYFALREAILAFNPNAGDLLDAPLTPEKTLMALYPS